MSEIYRKPRVVTIGGKNGIRKILVSDVRHHNLLAMVRVEVDAHLDGKAQCHHHQKHRQQISPQPETEYFAQEVVCLHFSS